jgi:Asp-tRNA(Asn)/Glu-tRNA(Gln) amidotransferase C subunit
VDADWAGNWSQATTEDPSCAHSRSGYVITYAGCPVLWGSKMQTLIALSTTEAELIALSTALREVIAMMNLLEELKERGVPVPFTRPVVKCTAFEDNVGALELAKQPKMRPRTKHLSIKLHHFRDHVREGKIIIQHISTKDQIADQFTKPLERIQFQSLRKLLLGW